MKKLRFFALFLALSAGACLAQDAGAPAVQTFSVKTGYFNGQYYYTGVLLAALNSNAPAGLPCGQGGSCGPENTVLAVESSTGSFDNLHALCAGKTDSALVQSNLAYMAYAGTGAFAGTAPCKQLRAAASLYPEYLQIAVKKDSAIQSLADLQGKTVAAGAQQSGTFDAMKTILNAAGIDPETVQFSSASLGEAAKELQDGKADALAFFAGAPAPVFAGLNDKTPLRFLPVTGSGIDALLAQSPYYQAQTLPAGSYENVPEVRTITVHALWAVTEKADDKTIYALTKNLWDKEHRPSWFAQLPPKGALDPAHSLDGIGIPLHKGAKRYYNEIGKRF